MTVIPLWEGGWVITQRLRRPSNIMCKKGLGNVYYDIAVTPN